MISHFFSSIATNKSKVFLFFGVAGLLVSPISGCTAASKTLDSDHNQHKVSAPAQAGADTTTNQIVVHAANNSHQYQQYYMNPQARIAQLKDAQLHAQSTKVTYSKHAVINTNVDHQAPRQTQEPATVRSNQYTVEPGENLYAIAAKSSTYDDGLLWPLIYKSNRDQIKDPEQIFPGQLLTISHKHSELEKETARETARKSGIFIH